ncbi:MAG: ABC transporter ATP-binding protein [Desulfobacteraceae bacterium]|nr:ABC transporter ATP-binding protein [Desulfobacteraceae bacterium]
MQNITKTYETNNLRANDDVTFEARKGEIHALVGENGAGKTTLMKILYGIERPDTGKIIIENSEVNIRSPIVANKHGIGMVHQHFKLINEFTVAQNVVLGMEPKHGILLFDNKRAVMTVSDVIKKNNFHISPVSKISELSVGQMQQVEIIKMLYRKADLLILDEPTSVLTPGEAIELFAILNDMKDQGHMIIFISHKLDEIMEICDRVVVLRKGEIIGDAETKETDKKSLAKMMIGREVIFNITKEKIQTGEPVLNVNKINVLDDKGLPALQDISFTIHENEILGIAGVAGNGQKELAEAITGIRTISSGKVTIKDKNITNISPRKIFDHGVSHVPEERIKFGIAPGLFLYDNAILKQHHLDKYSKKSFLQYDKIKAHTKNLIDKFNVSAPSINTEIRNLSGGNIQKLILGREISEQPSLLVASHPTYGLDVGATQYLREQLLERRKLGGAVLLFSEDLDEIFELCDKIAIIFEGRFTGILDADDKRLSDIGLMMAGSLEHV